MLLMCFEVLTRYIMVKPWLLVEELILYIIFWVYFLGAAYATYNRTHIKVEMLEGAIKNPVLKSRIKVAALLVTVMLCCLFTVWAWQYTAWGFRMGEYAPMTGLPMVYAQLSIAIGFPLMCLYFLQEWLDQISEMRRYGH